MSPASESEIYRAIKESIIQQRLRPNTQLVEDVIAESFGVSRTPVRNVFRRLASEKLVNVIPYKGTFVACPTVEETREVFEMRRVLESAIVKKVCGTLTALQIEQLRSVLNEERRAHDGMDRAGALQASGEFHLRLADMAGNSYLSKCLEELVALTYVIISFYGDRTMAYCGDHENILTAIQQADSVEAERLMLHHLDELEGSLHVHEQGMPARSVSEVLSQYRSKT